MKVFFSQIYIKQGVNFPFSHQFQAHLSEQITPGQGCRHSSHTSMRDFNVIFRIMRRKRYEIMNSKANSIR